MPTPGQPITYADIKAIADLATTKLAPNTYVVPQFAGSDKIALPASISAQPLYGVGGLFLDGSKVTINLYAYKTISGVKYYTWIYALKAITGQAGSGNFSVKLSWTNPTGTTAPDGYIIVVPQILVNPDGWEYFWLDIGNVATYTTTGSFAVGWKADGSLYANRGGAELDIANSLPCGHGAWLKVLNLIHSDLFLNSNLYRSVGFTHTFGPSWLLSGPWCVSAGNKCYPYLTGLALTAQNTFYAYANLKFVYSPIDSPEGNQISSEIDVATPFTAANGANNLNFSVNGTFTGKIVLLSSPNGQTASDFDTAFSGASTVTITVGTNGSQTTITFDAVDAVFSSGSPIVATATPLHGGNITSGTIAGEFTATPSVLTPTDTLIIAYSGTSGKSVGVPGVPDNLSFTPPSGSPATFTGHWRSQGQGVWVANTLPVLGLFTYLDNDLPNYSPGPEQLTSRRTALDDALPHIDHVNNRGVLWPVFHTDDFTPDSVFGAPFFGSKAWQATLATKYAEPTSQTHAVSPSGIAGTLYRFPISVPTDSFDLRLLSENPNTVLYARLNNFPTKAVFDAKVNGGTWLSLLDAGVFATGTWFIGIENTTSAVIQNTVDWVLIEVSNAPQGTFFKTALDDNHEPYPLLENVTYHFNEGIESMSSLPTPLSGYCIYSLTVSRLPVDNGSGIAVAPSTGTSVLNVDVGTELAYAWDEAGTFNKLKTVTIPAGQASVTLAVFWPVTDGTPLVTTSKDAFIRALVNYQPAINSEFFPETDTVNGGFAVTVGNYQGAANYNPDYALLTFKGGVLSKPILLPVAASVYDDLLGLLNILP